MNRSEELVRIPAVSSGQVARLTGVSIEKINELAKVGILEPHVTPTGRRLFRLLDVDKASAHFVADAAAKRAGS